MKPHFLTLTLLLALIQPASAAVRHTGVSLNTYVDFATNSGRYTTKQPNALLEYLRKQNGGVRIPYTTGHPAYILPHGCPDFGAVSDSGNTTAVACNYVASVAHNASQLYPTFGLNNYGVGTANSQKYVTIEEYGATSTFVHHIFHGTNDFKISRLCKIATDVVPAPMAAGLDYKGKLIYRVGGGLQQLRDAQGRNSDESIQDVYLVGGVASIVNWQCSGNDLRIHQGSIIGTTGWAAKDIGDGTPLPFGTTQGDSGSPYFVWEDGTFKFLMAHHGSTNGNRQTLACEATDWARSTMEADNVTVPLSSVHVKLLLSATETETDKGSLSDTINGLKITANPSRSYLRDARGNMYTPNGDCLVINGIPSGQHTWKSLSPLRNVDSWYAYGTEFLNAGYSVVMENKEPTPSKGLTYSGLFLTQNLVLKATESGKAYNVEVAEDIDLGAGYLHLSTEKCENVTCTISSAKGALPDTAGFVVDAGATLRLDLCNTATDYTREWRKVGAGTLSLCGKGKNEVLLNVGGSGLTQLEQRDGYAAWNVLVNTGATVRIRNTEQIARDLTFGTGGGTLDMAGNSMDWYTSGGESRSGFSIRALTEQAVISNSTGNTTLTFRESGEQQFPGSFRDSETGSLCIIYAGGSNWQLTGTHTALRHPKSSLIVQNGCVTLTGTPTVHGYGTKHTRDTADFSTLPNDWHYADALMSVQVKPGATFCLGSHARLTGHVTVENGGTYTMHEGVQHASEHIEGGESPENTAAIADYYGHKGSVHLRKGAKMRMLTRPETDTPAIFSGCISGPGDLHVASASPKAAWHIAGDLIGLNNLSLESGQLIIDGHVDARNISVQKDAILTLRLPSAQKPQSTPAKIVNPDTTKAKKNLLLTKWDKKTAIRIPAGKRILALNIASLKGKLGGTGTLELDLTRLQLPVGSLLRLQFIGATLPTSGSLRIQARTSKGTASIYRNASESGTLYIQID